MWPIRATKALPVRSARDLSAASALLPILAREPHFDEFVVRQGAGGFGHHGVREAGIAHDPDGLRTLRADWSDLEVPGADEGVGVDFVLMDEDFHERVAAAAGNVALVGQLRKVNERIRIVRMQDFLTAERVAQTIEQHLGVLDPLIAGDLAVAEERLVGHFAESLTVVEQRAALTLARMLERRHG